MNSDQNSLRFLNSFGTSENTEDGGLTVVLKLLSIVLILAMSVLFGFFPFFW